MGSLRAFRCEWCPAEVVATSRHAAVLGGAVWTPSVRCCGQPLRPLEIGEVLAAGVPRRRVARGIRCGVAVGLIVHPVRPLVCALCQAEVAVGKVDAGAPVARDEQVSGRASGK